MKQSHKTLLLWVLLIVMFLAIWQFLQPGERKQQVSFSEFMTWVHAGQVPDVHVKDREYSFTHVVDGKNTQVETLGPVADEALIEDLENNPLTKDEKFKIYFEKEDTSPFWSSTLVTLLPMVFIGIMFFLFMRQLQAGGGKAMSFGKAKARMLSDSQNKVTFADVAGIDEAKDEVEEIIAFLKDPKKFQRLGGRIPKGVLMIGPPGTGKTLLARAIAGEAGVPFFSISGSDFVEMFVGVGASRVRDLFEQGKKHAPCIIFIDEIDAVGRHRGAGLGGGHDEREQTLNQLLVEMDGFESNEGVIIIAATNRPDVLDPAILRPGRFDRRITVPRPDVRGREGILRVHAKRTPLSPDVDLEILARGTPGLRRRRPREPRQRGRPPRRPSGQGRGQDGRLRAGQGQGLHGHRAPLDGHQRRGEADHRRARGRAHAHLACSSTTTTRSTRSRSSRAARRSASPGTCRRTTGTTCPRSRRRAASPSRSAAASPRRSSSAR